MSSMTDRILELIRQLKPAVVIEVPESVGLDWQPLPVVPPRPDNPVIVIAEQVGQVVRLLSGDPVNRSNVLTLPVRMRNGLLVTTPNTTFARVPEQGTLTPAAWFFEDSHVRVAECWLCGCPASWVEADDSAERWDRSSRRLGNLPDQRRMKLAPCGHNMSDVSESIDPAACLCQVTAYGPTDLPKVATWLNAW